MGRQTRSKFSNGNSYYAEPLPERGPGENVKSMPPSPLYCLVKN